MAEPVYPSIAWIDNPDHVWEIIERGEGDWLGVWSGVCLVGLPRRSGVIELSGVEAHNRGGQEGFHGVEVLDPGGNRGAELCASADEARAAFERTVGDKEKSTPLQPRLEMVRLLQHGHVTDQTVILALPDTEGEPPPPPGTVWPPGRPGAPRA